MRVIFMRFVCAVVFVLGILFNAAGAGCQPALYVLQPGYAGLILRNINDAEGRVIEVEICKERGVVGFACPFCDQVHLFENDLWAGLVETEYKFADIYIILNESDIKFYSHKSQLVN